MMRYSIEPRARNYIERYGFAAPGKKERENLKK